MLITQQELSLQLFIVKGQPWSIRIVFVTAMEMKAFEDELQNIMVPMKLQPLTISAQRETDEFTQVENQALTRLRSLITELKNPHFILRDKVMLVHSRFRGIGQY